MGKLTPTKSEIISRKLPFKGLILAFPFLFTPVTRPLFSHKKINKKAT
jgi:hypothetical protein